MLAVQVFLVDFFDSKCCDCTGSNREGGDLGGAEGRETGESDSASISYQGVTT